MQKLEELVNKIAHQHVEETFERLMSDLFPDHDPEADRTLHLASCTCKKCKSRWKYGQPIITTHTF